MYKEIIKTEEDFCVAQENQGEFALNFGLMEVVYKWALSEVSINKLTITVVIS